VDKGKRRKEDFLFVSFCLFVFEWEGQVTKKKKKKKKKKFLKKEKKS